MGGCRLEYRRKIVKTMVGRRLSLAVAMIHSSDILILDEPTSGINPVARESLALARTSRSCSITCHSANRSTTLPKLALPSLTKNLVLDRSDTEDEPDGGRLVIARFARSARPSSAPRLDNIQQFECWFSI